MRCLWFKAKTYGWGWTPATWQGWLVTVAYIGAVFASALIFLRPKPAAAGWIEYGIAIILLSAILIVVAFKTGERARWRWGGKNCEKCGKPAVAHLTEVADGRKIERHLCTQCVAQLYPHSGSSNPTTEELLRSFVEGHVKEHSERRPE
jgi:hypothetical protein